MSVGFFGLYRRITAAGIDKFLKDHPDHKFKKELKDMTDMLKDTDFEGSEMSTFYQEYEMAEDEFNCGEIESASGFSGLLHDAIVNFLSDYKIELGRDEYSEITNTAVKEPELKKFIEKNLPKEDEEEDEDE